jgi:hypothetical protein
MIRKEAMAEISYVSVHFISGSEAPCSTTATATIGLCIIVRPLLGFISDSVPICGLVRKSYFSLAALGASGCFATLATWTTVPIDAAVGLLCAANVMGYAWCGVILYAIIATEQRRDPVDGAAQLNAVQ